MKQYILALFISLMSLMAHAADYSVIRTYEYPVLIRQTTQDNTLKFKAFGSGVVIAPGYMITAYHVVEDNLDNVMVAVGSKPSQVKVVKYDAERDMALLQSPDIKCPCALLAQPNLTLDQDAYSVGHPLITQYRTQFVNHGTIQGSTETRIISTATTTSGGSGGGLFVFQDGQYRYAGIVVSIGLERIGSELSSFTQYHNWIVFSVKPELVRSFLKDIPGVK